MNRREAIQGLGVLAVGIAAPTATPATSGRVQNSVPVQWPFEPIPSEVAGVRIVDSSIAKRATNLSRSVSPPYLFNHAIRTFIFGSLVGRSRKQKFDEEILYLACIMHDLGLAKTESLG